jgi:hypothetical protein
MPAEFPHLATKLKHVDIQHHWLRQEVSKKNIQIEWISTAEMSADGLTTSLPRQKHEIFVKQLDVAKPFVRPCQALPSLILPGGIIVS